MDLIKIGGVLRIKSYLLEKKKDKILEKYIKIKILVDVKKVACIT